MNDMEYDYRKNPRAGMYPGPSSTVRPPTMYPNLGQTQTQTHTHTPASFPHPPPSSSGGIGIRVAIKPEYRITPPPQMTPPIGEIPRSNFHFEFDLEKKILAEAEKEAPNWTALLAPQNLPSKPTEPTSSLAPSPDPVLSKYLALGLSREAVPTALANYGDNPSKVKAFCNGYNLLREMGFSPNSVAEALLMFDNDTDKALGHFLNNPS